MAFQVKHALVTGGSRGIGRGIALALAAQRANVAIHYYQNEAAAKDTLAKVLGRYRNAEVVWCQEEPQNMGAWTFVDRRLEQVLAGLDVAAKRPRFAGRAEAASPATGLFKRHVEEQGRLVSDALAA